MVVQLSAETTLSSTPQVAFALTLDTRRFADLFRGFGPIPGIRRITAHQPPAVGATRTLENTDGSRLTECITRLEAPHRHAYTLSGLRPPLAWLARSGHADWTFTAAPEGSRVIWQYRFELTSPLAWPLAAPLLYLFMRTSMHRCLAAMARELDSMKERTI